MPQAKQFFFARELFKKALCLGLAITRHSCCCCNGQLKKRLLIPVLVCRNHLTCSKCCIRAGYILHSFFSASMVWGSHLVPQPCWVLETSHLLQHRMTWGSPGSKHLNGRSYILKIEALRRWSWSCLLQQLPWTPVPAYVPALRTTVVVLSSAEYWHHSCIQSLQRLHHCQI